MQGFGTRYNTRFLNDKTGAILCLLPLVSYEINFPLTMPCKLSTFLSMGALLVKGVGLWIQYETACSINQS
jgi:hypothetical protein